MPNVLQQVLDPPLTVGEDATVVIEGDTFDTDPSDWAVELRLWRTGRNNWRSWTRKSLACPHETTRQMPVAIPDKPDQTVIY